MGSAFWLHPELLLRPRFQCVANAQPRLALLRLYHAASINAVEVRYLHLVESGKGVVANAPANLNFVKSRKL